MLTITTHSRHHTLLGIGEQITPPGRLLAVQPASIRANRSIPMMGIINQSSFSGGSGFTFLPYPNGMECLIIETPGTLDFA